DRGSTSTVSQLPDGPPDAANGIARTESGAYTPNMKPASFPDREQRFRVKAECTDMRLRKATRAVGRIYDQTLAPSGLRGTQFSLPVGTPLFGEAPLLRVAEELGLDRTPLTRNLQPLEREGLVASSPGKDQRVRLLRLTEAGQRTLQRAYPLWEEAHSKVVQGLGQRRWMTLLDGLEAPLEPSPGGPARRAPRAGRAMRQFVAVIGVSTLKGSAS